MTFRVRRRLRPSLNRAPPRARTGRCARSCRLLVECLESRLAPSAAANIGVNRPITNDPGVQQMPSVTADPHDANHLVVSYLDYTLVSTGYAGIGVAVSQDGGSTWQHTAVPLPAGFDQGAADPIAHFDDQGHVFVSFAGATFLGPKPPLTDPSGAGARALGLQANNGVFVARSEDGGLTWDQPVAVVSHLYDGQDKVPFEIKPDLAVDTFAMLPNGRPNPNYGSLYEVWSRYYPAGQFPGEAQALGGSDIMFAVSRDGGRTWQLQLQPQPDRGSPVSVIQNYANTGMDAPEGSGHENWSHVTAGPEGNVYVSNFAGGLFAVHHSTDGGASFANPDLSTSALFPFGNNTDVFPSPSLATNHFRTQDIRAIAADPTRPGYLYVADGAEIDDPFANALDNGDVVFARSTDYGATWQTTFQVGTHAANVLNDDNDGQRATGRPDDVTAGQALPRLVTDAQGDVALIWYDTRRDPAGHLLDVFGTVSSDGGQTFSPNFRVTDQSFDANAGKFTDAAGKTDYYLGDALGLAVANHTAYAAWTDTRNGNQDVFITSYPVNPPPAAANDRFEPNDTAATATDLGRVVTRDLPKLAIAPGDEDWFHVRAAATGSLTVTATLASPGDRVRLELRDASGATLLTTGTAIQNANGQITGQALTFPGHSGQAYLVRVLPGPEAAAGTPARYTLDVRSLTADLGTQVYGAQSGSLAAGDQAFYALAAAAPGSLEVTLTPGPHAQGNFQLELLDPNNLATPLASGQVVGAIEQVSVAVTSGQAVYIHVAADGGAQGDFTLTFTNLDQFTTPDNKVLFFPTGSGPSEAVLADLTGNGRLDIVVSHVGRDVVSVLRNNGDGTFQVPRDYPVGAFVQGSPSTLSGLPNFHRDLAIADLNGDGIPDIVVVNHDSGDLSILFGRGDGTFQPQRRVDATAAPFALAVGDLNNDGIPDLVVVDSTGGPARGVVLLGRGDGTFQPPLPFALPHGEVFRTNAIAIADVNHDGKNDLVERDFVSGTVVLLGNGDGTFGAALPAQLSNGPGLALADLNGDGNLDVVTTSDTTNFIKYSLGNGDGTFQPVQELPPGQTPVAVAVADFGSAVTLPDGSTVLGPPDGHPDLIVADNGLTQPLFNGPPEIVMLPGLVDDQGKFAGFGTPIHLASARGPLDVKVADVNGDGAPDIVVVDADGVEVIYGKPPIIPPNSTPQTARNLGTVVHVLESTQTIVPGHADAYYTLTVPTEAARGAGDEVLDFSGLFQATAGAGLSVEVRDPAGNLLGSGERFRVRAPQGAVLTLHVFGVTAADGSRGAGAYTLDVDVLPQVVAVEAQPLLPGSGPAPGGPTTSLVVTLQGDRLDPATAQDPANYTVTWLGPDGVPGTADDRVIPVAATQGVVYDPSSNVDVASGNVYPTAVRQTVTLLFADPLPPGSYRVELAPTIQAAAFNDQEAGLLSAGAGFTGHPVVSRDGAQVTEGSRRTATDLVFASGALGDLGVFPAGTPFLTQLHDDLGALLDAGLTRLGDAPSIPPVIDSQILDRFAPALGPASQRPVAVLVIWLDPPAIGLVDSTGQRVVYNPQARSYQSTFQQGSVIVAGNVEVLVLPFVPTAAQDYLLTVADVSPLARGGAVYLGRDGGAVTPLTAALRAGTTQFRFSFGPSAPSVLQVDTQSAPAAATDAASLVAPPVLPVAGDSGPARTAPAASGLSPVAVLVAVGTRQRTALVIAIAPRLDSLAPVVPPGPNPALSPVVAGDAAAAVASSGGGGGGAAEAWPVILGRLRALLEEVGRPFLEAGGRVGNLVDGLGVQLRALLRALDARAREGNNPPAPVPPERDDPPPDQPEEGAELLPLEAEAAARTVPACAGREADVPLAAVLAVAGAGSAWGAACREAGRADRKRQPGNEEQTDG
jgi:hypothetical protein